MKTRIAMVLLTLLVTISASAGVPDNDATCDIKVGPAATLLLPYFEIDLQNGEQTSLFTITNVSRYSQIAHVTLWTDCAFPFSRSTFFLPDTTFRASTCRTSWSEALWRRRWGQGQRR